MTLASFLRLQTLVALFCAWLGPLTVVELHDPAGLVSCREYQFHPTKSYGDFSGTALYAGWQRDWQRDCRRIDHWLGARLKPSFDDRPPSDWEWHW